MPMRYTALAAVIALPGTANAECFICDTSVVLDAHAAACFRERAEHFLEAARSHPAQWTEVNLAGCDASRGLDSFPSLRAEKKSGAPEQGNTAASTVLFLDVNSIECLSRRLADDEIDGVLEVNFEAECD